MNYLYSNGLRRNAAPVIPMPAARGRYLRKMRFGGGADYPPQQVQSFFRVGRSVPDHLDVSVAQQYGAVGLQDYSKTGQIPDRPRRHLLRKVLIGAGIVGLLYLILR